VDWIHVPVGRIKRKSWALTIITFRFCRRWGISWSTERLFASRRTLLLKVTHTHESNRTIPQTSLFTLYGFGHMSLLQEILNCWFIYYGRRCWRRKGLKGELLHSEAWKWSSDGRVTSVLYPGRITAIEERQKEGKWRKNVGCNGMGKHDHLTAVPGVPDIGS
jgi:hypothetical protein